jgi:hypothetical protein
MQNSSKVIIWIVVVVIIIAAIVYGVSRNGRDTDGMENNTISTNDNSAATIAVADQFPGNIVYVSNATFGKNGFVVIHKDENGAPGKIIGSAYFAKGVNPGTVELTESLTEGGKYFAMVHDDDGDRIFDATKDLPSKDTSGAVIMKSFISTKDLPEIKG